jgi:hypothetical protein
MTAAALLSACSQANTHPTFPLFAKCRDTETGLSVAGWASQLAKVVIVQTQQTQISGRKSNGTKHSGGPPKDGRKKRPKHVGGFILTNTFLTFYWF